MANLALNISSNASSALPRINSYLDNTSVKAEKLQKQFSNIKIPNFKSDSAFTFPLSDMAGKAKATFDSIVASATSIVTAFTSINSVIEQSLIMLSTATGSAESGAAAFEYITNLAKKAPYSIDILTDSFVKLKVAGIQDTERVLETLVDSISAFGGTDDQLKLVTIAIQQMAGKGVISMEELRRQFGEQIPTAIKAMASELNMTTLDMYKKISRGQLSSDIGIDALITGLEKLHSGAAAKRMDSFAGSLAHIRNEWVFLMKDIADGNGSFKSISTAINSVADSMETFRNSAKGMELIDSVSRKISSAMKQISENPEIVEQFFSEVGSYADVAISSLSSLLEILNNVISGYDLLAGKTAATNLGQGAVDFNDFDMKKYSLIREDLIKITELQRQIDQNKPNILPDNPITLAEKFKKITEMFGDLGNKDFMVKYGFEFNQDEVYKKIEELKNSIREKLEGKGKPKLDLDVSKARASIDSVLKIDPSNRFASVSKTMSSVASSFSSAMDQITKDYIEVSEELDKENAKILNSQRDLADELRSIAREGMSDNSSYEDLINQINEYKRAANEAGKSKNWEEQLALLSRAKDLIKSMPTSGISELVTAEDVEQARQLYEYYDRISRGGKSMDISKYADEYNKLKAIYEGEGDKKKEIISSQEQINTKLAETKKVGEDIIALESKHKQELEEKKKTLEKQVEEYKEKLKSLAEESQGLNDTSGKLGEVWVKVGDTFAHVAKSIAGDLDKLDAQIKDLMDGMNNLKDKSSGSSSNLPGRASGGPVTKGVPYMVGERGREVFVPNSNGTIIPNNSLFGASTIDVTINGGDRVSVSGSRKNVTNFIKAVKEMERYSS